MKPCYRGNDDCPDDCCLGAGPLPTREQELRQIHGHPDPATDPVKLMRELASAVDHLREIAAEDGAPALARRQAE